ncbi:transposase [Mycobacterium lacus]|uniref:Mutator family transposase n=1 Tax=Mycobacterium lacus TaxID=169765 RepID=A0A1X1YUZ5_9MYCO|nr:IS256 family transposase [Mycobacterium lacus]ORW14918.1 transposase [Mycobacterium lacus]BBX95090.1 IS256 family transposase [Mycobacterium lacus]
MANPRPIDGDRLLADRLAQASPDLLRELLSTFIHALMSADADAMCRAGYGQRNDGRANSRNGYRRRNLETRLGAIKLAIPKLRFDNYFPDWLLGHRERAERVLTNVVAICYLLGVSIQRMERLVESLGVTRLSRLHVAVIAAELDAAVTALRTRPLDGGPHRFVAVDTQMLMVHQRGRAVGLQLAIATGVNAHGHREILGTQLSRGEDGARWLRFFSELRARGLSGVALVTSDSHTGLVAAIDATWPGAAWQRCITSYGAELMSVTPQSCWRWVHTLLHSVFDQTDAESVVNQYDRVLEILREQLPKAGEHVAAARSELLAYTAFPHQFWRQIYQNNPCAYPRSDRCAVNGT